MSQPQKSSSFPTVHKANANVLRHRGAVSNNNSTCCIWKQIKTTDTRTARPLQVWQGNVICFYSTEGQRNTRDGNHSGHVCSVIDTPCINAICEHNQDTRLFANYAYLCTSLFPPARSMGRSLARTQSRWTYSRSCKLLWL